MENIIFGPNNHSKFKIGWRDINNGEAQKIAGLVAAHYDFCPTGVVQQVDEFEQMSHNFRVEIQEKLNRKFVLLRKNIRIKDERTIVTLGILMTYLGHRGIPIPSAISTKDGQPFFSYNGHIWQLFEFISGDHFRGTSIELTEAARNIAKLHLVLADTQLPVFDDVQKYLVWNLDDWHNIFRLARLGDSAVDRKVKAHEEFLLEQARLVVEDRNKNAPLTRQWIHADLHPLNTIFLEGGQLKSFLDFEKVYFGELARDVGKACHRLVRQFVVFQEKPWRESLREGVRIFFEEYLKIHPLNDIDLDFVPRLLRDDLVSLAHYVLQQWYTHQNTNLVEKGEFDKFLILLEESLHLETTFRELRS